MFKLENEDFKNLKSQIVISSWGGRRKMPLAFTEQGVAMLSGLLHSKVAVQANIAIGELSARIEEKKNEPRPRIGFK